MIRPDPETMEVVKSWVDVLSIGALMAWMVDIAPAIATLFTAIWSVLRVYETKTVQGWLGRKR